MVQISASQHLPVRSYECGKMRWVKVATATGAIAIAIVCANISILHLSITVQRICMKLGVVMTHYNGCLTLALQH